jgi:hypothetical protein
LEVAVLRADKRKEAEGKLFSLLLPFLGFVKKQGSRGEKVRYKMPDSRIKYKKFRRCIFTE